jgi:hypothetical protein
MLEWPSMTILASPSEQQGQLDMPGTEDARKPSDMVRTANMLKHLCDMQCSGFCPGTRNRVREATVLTACPPPGLVKFEVSRTGRQQRLTG